MTGAIRRRACASGAALFVLAGSFALSAAASGSTVTAQAVEGVLFVAHGDSVHGEGGHDHAQGHGSMVSAELRTRNGRVKVRVPATRQREFLALSGKRVRVRGTRTATALDADSATQVATTSAQAVLSPVRRIAVVMLHTKGSTTEPVTVAQAQANFFGATNSVAHWFTETSGGAVSVTGQVYGYYDSAYAPSGCTNLSSVLSSFLNEAAARAAADGYVASNYDHLVVYTPAFTGSGCGFSGVAWVGANGVLLNGTISRGVATHELGHNLGLWHAGTLDCGAQVVGGTCTRYDYGDPFDVMGQASANRQFNAPHKATVGWIPAPQVMTATSGTQTVTLTSSAQPVDGATLLVKVRAPNGTTYGVEKRSSSGTYDTGMFGVWVRLLGFAGTDDTQLLDMTPATTSFSDGNLAAGMTFTDSANGVTITTLSEGATSASVRVVIGGGTTTTTAAPTTTTTVAPTTTTTAPPQNAVYVSSDGKTVTVTGTTGDDLLSMWKIRNNRLGVRVWAPIVAGRNCTVSADVASCAGSAFKVLAGAGNDRITVQGAIRSSQYGGDGDDWMVGGTSADVFSGGAGFDTVDYSGRSGTITGTPGTGADDGARREKDNIMGDVEQVVFP
jgi:hypothetical protein